MEPPEDTGEANMQESRSIHPSLRAANRPCTLYVTSIGIRGSRGKGWGARRNADASPGPVVHALYPEERGLGFRSAQHPIENGGNRRKTSHKYYVTRILRCPLDAYYTLEWWALPHPPEQPNLVEMLSVTPERRFVSGHHRYRATEMI